MRKILSLLLILTLLPLCTAAEGASLGITPVTEVIRPGRAVLLSFSVPEAGVADLDLVNESGERLSVAVLDLSVRQGLNHVWWNGTYESVPAPEGSWLLRLTQNGLSATVPVTVGPLAPYITAISPLLTTLTPAASMTVSFYASCSGTMTTTLISGGERSLLASWPISAGNNSLTWTGMGQRDGRYQFEMQLTDETGDQSQAETFPVTLSGFDAYYAARDAEQAALDADRDETIVEEEPSPAPSEAEDPADDEAADEEPTKTQPEPQPEVPETVSEPEESDETPPAEDIADVDEETDLPEDAEDVPDADAETAPEDAEDAEAPDADAENADAEDTEAPDVDAEAPATHDEGQVIEEEEFVDELPEDERLDQDSGDGSGAPAGVSRESDNLLVACSGEDQAVFTPSYSSPYAGRDETINYWTTPMNIADEEAVWNILMEPITVLDNGKKKAERMQVVIHEEPSEDSAPVGLATCITQGVHVLERGETWSLIECYSSSFYATTVEAWNMLVQGYVPTKYLKTVTPSQKFGLVVDKLTQRLYIFKDGKLYDTLLVSTGLTNAKQPFNETRSGEFLMQDPAVGEFRSDNIYCSMGIRFNDGDLLHEVPHQKLADGGRTYKTTEYKLGTKASHGCIRVQRRRTPKRTSMTWIWNNRANNVKILIWEDWQGRQLSYASDDMVLYYNPKGGSMYHTAETCYSAVGKVFTPFTYGQLEDEGFAKLTRCEWCSPPLRRAEIDAINATYAPGGDHDPIMTKAREKYLRNR
ncbi:MAG: L,D-transpeptidase family protein [Clostridia bacterium]|nr:L,D-transpeptidase family protein [Clostridia bacterium]